MVSHIDQIPVLLLNCLSILNDSFNENEYTEQFRNLESNVDRLNFVYKDLKKHNLFLSVVEDRKNDRKATHERQLGDKLFAVQQYDKALKRYTSSIKMAKNQKVLALGYVNRAACLYKLGMFNECHLDIERAIANDYLSDKDARLYEYYMKKSATNFDKFMNYEPIPEIPSHQKNPLIQCASDCIKIEQNEEFGRFVVATRDIRIGEVLCVEKPFSYMLEKNKLIHCHHCLELCYNPIPCESCTEAVYCSESCKAEAFRKYHQFECSVLKTLTEYGMSRLILPLRTTLLAREWYNHLDGLKFNQNEFYRSDRYNEVHCLLAGTDKRSVQDLFKKAVNAALVFHLVYTTTNLLNQPKIKEGFKEVLMLQMQICPCTGFEIYEYVITENRFDNMMVAAGLYPFSSLFNHSCCPNVVRTFYGSSIVLRSFNTIKKGEQCFITYGPQYNFDLRWKRQMRLSSAYQFDCKCEACEQDWLPDLSPLPLSSELQIPSAVYNFCYTQLLMGNVHVATELLPKVIAALENCEDLEPFGPAHKLKSLLYLCYRVFGNKAQL